MHTDLECVKSLFPSSAGCNVTCAPFFGWRCSNDLQTTLLLVRASIFEITQQRWPSLFVSRRRENKNCRPNGWTERRIGLGRKRRNRGGKRGKNYGPENGREREKRVRACERDRDTEVLLPSFLFLARAASSRRLARRLKKTHRRKGREEKKAPTHSPAL